ncbi:hypothetical protein [Methanobrevibacter filiformis]|uniref:Uncharacterized protein n=1 Tax=Methanobrevibacter filiformis TaxID=55758 RepID=A0A165ZGC0_9EURY|nr:hypothetical protein [Methanobrevibacter filiformis]KZX10674.1 hypothetical protein MBFIL_16650 [Methanobrevibacter filiformis]
MVLKINSEILDFIENSKYKEEEKKFLIASIILEAKRYKTKYARFTEEYDTI